MKPEDKGELAQHGLIGSKSNIPACRKCEELKALLEELLVAIAQAENLEDLRLQVRSALTNAEEKPQAGETNEGL